MTVRPRFHLAFPVVCLDSTRRFFVDVLGASVGRSAERWVDFDLYGHQLSAHLVDSVDDIGANGVDGDAVPVRHFGCILSWDAWEALARRVEDQGVDFRIAPKVRFVGEVGEQATFFVDDPSGNSLEFKAFRDDASVFAAD